MRTCRIALLFLVSSVGSVVGQRVVSESGGPRAAGQAEIEVDPGGRLLVEAVLDPQVAA